MAEVPRTVMLFSPLFDGSQEAWEWICDVTNGRGRPAPPLTAEQKVYAEQAGYLPLPIDAKRKANG